MEFSSKWVISESSPEKKMKERFLRFDVSLKPRIEAIGNHIDELIMQIDRRMPQSTDQVNKIGEQDKINAVYHSGSYIPGFLLTRKLAQVIQVSKILLGRLASQLRNVSDLGDIVIVLCPAILIIKNIRFLLISCFPEASQELGYLCEMLKVVLVDAAQLGSYTINFKTANETALHLISEASINRTQK
jgi:hypothetical protein